MENFESSHDVRTFTEMWHECDLEPKAIAELDTLIERMDLRVAEYQSANSIAKDRRHAEAFFDGEIDAASVLTSQAHGVGATAHPFFLQAVTSVVTPRATQIVRRDGAKLLKILDAAERSELRARPEWKSAELLRGQVRRIAGLAAPVTV